MITIEKYYSLIKQGYSLDLVYLLLAIKNNIVIDSENKKIETLLHTLMRKGLLSEEKKITLEGENLINFIHSESDVVVYTKQKPSEDAFKEFWEAFPSTDTFEYNNVKFEGSRALKMNKPECKIKFDAIINEGEHTVKEIIEAVKYDVEQKKRNSYKTRQNKLSYLQNSLTYLRQRSFVPYIELMKSCKKESIQDIDVHSGFEI